LLSLIDTPQANRGDDHAAMASTMPITGRNGTYRA
jgi:hypothetical protein